MRPTGKTLTKTKMTNNKKIKKAIDNARRQRLFFKNLPAIKQKEYLIQTCKRATKKNIVYRFKKQLKSICFDIRDLESTTGTPIKYKIETDPKIDIQEQINIIKIVLPNYANETINSFFREDYDYHRKVFYFISSENVKIPLGVLVYAIVKKQLEIIVIGTDIRFQNIGIGGMLLKSLVYIKNITLITVFSDENAIQFYKKFSFVNFSDNIKHLTYIETIENNQIKKTPKKKDKNSSLFILFEDIHKLLKTCSTNKWKNETQFKKQSEEIEKKLLLRELFPKIQNITRITKPKQITNDYWINNNIHEIAKYKPLFTQKLFHKNINEYYLNIYNSYFDLYNICKFILTREELANK